jgi:tocopherol O-methyltransferase
VARWYERRTTALLAKYAAPGQRRVHYHLGCTTEEEVGRADDLRSVQQLMFESQERLLERAFSAWRASNFEDRVLDAGCGFGGTCLWAAERFGAEVVGVTIAASHAVVVRRLIAEAELSTRVQVRVGDIHDFRDERPFSAIISFEAANLFDDRERWFRRMAEALRVGGTLCIDDYFAEAGADRATFNEVYASHIGTRDEYVELAAKAGFELVSEVDVTHETAAFWSLLARFSALSTPSSQGVYHSPDFHFGLAQAQRERFFTQRLLQFRRKQ